MDANETKIYYTVVITGVLLGGIILYFAFAGIRYQSRGFARLRRYFLTEIDMIEKDRTRIAHDLHDQVGPLLAITQFHIRSFLDGLPGEARQLEAADRTIQQVLESLGGIAGDLTPKSLHVKGLDFALKDFTAQLRWASKLPVQFDYEVRSQLPSDIGIHIYRIVQELLHNALKHSAATNVVIRIWERRKTLCIFYRDDGKGFSRGSTSKKSEGIGLRSIRNRTILVNGKMHCYTAPGKGTEYFFEIPLTVSNGNTD